MNPSIRMRPKIFPATLRSEMPWELPQSFWLPFLKMATIRVFLGSFGTALSSHMSRTSTKSYVFTASPHVCRAHMGCCLILAFSMLSFFSGLLGTHQGKRYGNPRSYRMLEDASKEVFRFDAMLIQVLFPARQDFRVVSDDGCTVLSLTTFTKAGP